ncbi:hypothetical protein [Roseateles sp. BYS96W]|uniref:Uncharacterized protein n=1 Tax=Pelomonas nitida TaxID=3299027 RepID=A0ABW7G6B5_9BURK
MSAALTPAESVCMLGLIAPQFLVFSRVLYTRQFWLVWGVVVGVAALWAMLVGISDAFNIGTVSLPGGRGHPRLVVPWPAAWAYFSGLLLAVAAAVLLGGIRPGSGFDGLQGLGVLFAVASLLMLALSEQFSSLRRFGFMLAVASLLGLVLWAGHRFGKWTAMALWVAVVACVVWSSAG